MEVKTETGLEPVQEAAVVQSHPSPVSPLKKDITLMGMDEIKDALDSGEVDAIHDAEVFDVNLSIEYFDFAQFANKPQRFMFLGIKPVELPDKVSGEIKTLTAAYLIDRERNLFYNCSVKLVSTFIAMQIAPRTMVEITMTGQKNTQSGGRMYLYRITPLIPAKA